MTILTSSHAAFELAKHHLVGGVNSPVRAFKHVGSTPIFMESGSGANVRDIDGNEYIDYVLSWGPLILGHAHPAVVKAVQDVATKGLSFGAPTQLETELAKLIQVFFPGLEKIRFMNSGTESTMTAIRLARGVTKRSLILKFDGCYHGHCDSLLVAAGSGALTGGKPDSDGVPESFVSQTLVLPYNDIESIKAVFREKGSQIAGVIVEPVAGNMGVVLPRPGFLETLRSCCTESGALLIFDEVMTGFRHQGGSAQAAFGIKPDLTCLGKVVGGGTPCAVLGGSAEIMDHLAPLGGVYQAGTLSGNPLAMAAGIATLQELHRTNGIQIAIDKTTELADGLRDLLKTLKLPYQVSSLGSMFCVFFRDGKVENLSDVCQADLPVFRHVFHSLLAQGVYIAPSAFEAGFLSCAHSSEDLTKTIAAYENAFLQLVGNTQTGR